jgi:hypothetical protein
MSVELTCWGEVCYAAQVPLGETEFDAPVRKVLSPPVIAVPIGNSKLKETGFTKLVKRDDGVYENVTARDGDSRYMERGKPQTIPDLSKTIGD